MNNPFAANIIGTIKNCIRLGMWIAIVVHAVILSVFSIVFTYYLLTFFWRYLARTYFSQEWGIH